MALVLGHRGASKYAPENTMAAFRLALEQGADGVETDVHLTADGVAVLQHNYDIDRNSNGTGNVEDMTFEALRKLDFGGYKGAEYKGEQIATLEDLLKIGHKCKLMNIEIKRPQKKPSDVARVTMDLIKKYGLLDRVLISSFDHDVVREVQALCPEVLTGVLYEDQYCPNIDEILADEVGYVQRMEAEFANPCIKYIVADDTLVGRYLEKGIDVAVWTVDDPELIKSCVRQGCKTIISNVPDIAVKAVNEVLE